MATKEGMIAQKAPSFPKIEDHTYAYNSETTINNKSCEF